MNALSGWCGLCGKPDCKNCRVADCTCPGCANRVALSQKVDGECDNRDAPAGCVNTAARANRTPVLEEEPG